VSPRYLTDSMGGAAVGAVILLLGVGLLFVLSGTSKTHANDRDDERDQARIRRGFEIAPVPLDLRSKDRALVGMGSYLVNAVAGCNDCHSPDPSLEYAAGGNPYFKGNPPKVISQLSYLAGGRSFGSLVPGSPAIVSRNLTPDRTGRPAGGLSRAEFLQIMRTGEDLDHLHPNCSARLTSNCFPANQPFNGDLLQIMPWPVYQSLEMRDLEAIYEYLSAIPCISGPASGVLHNDCT
jgi:hypothetical protein